MRVAVEKRFAYITQIIKHIQSNFHPPFLIVIKIPSAMSKETKLKKERKKEEKTITTKTVGDKNQNPCISFFLSKAVILPFV